MKTKARYLKLVEWSEEDQLYIGSIPGWLGACCHGDDEATVFQELSDILDEWLQLYESEGLPVPPATAQKTFSGKFQLRAGSDLHKLLSIRALESGESLNQLCVRVLKDALL